MTSIFNVKASLFTLILVVFAVGTIAFASVMKEKPVQVEQVVNLDAVNEPWYFHGDASDDPTDANNYFREPLENNQCSQNYEVICEIQAPDDGTGKPLMSAPAGSSTVEEEISNINSLLPSSTPPPASSTVTAYRLN